MKYENILKQIKFTSLWNLLGVKIQLSKNSNSGISLFSRTKNIFCRKLCYPHFFLKSCGKLLRVEWEANKPLVGSGIHILITTNKVNDVFWVREGFTSLLSERWRLFSIFSWRWRNDLLISLSLLQCIKCFVSVQCEYLIFSL